MIREGWMKKEERLLGLRSLNPCDSAVSLHLFPGVCTARCLIRKVAACGIITQIVVVSAFRTLSWCGELYKFPVEISFLSLYQGAALHSNKNTVRTRERTHTPGRRVDLLWLRSTRSLLSNAVDRDAAEREIEERKVHIYVRRRVRRRRTRRRENERSIHHPIHNTRSFALFVYR